MGMTQEEVVLKLGLDTGEFDRRLADHARIAKQYEGKAGSAFYTGSAEGGSMPQSWQLGHLSRMSQEALKARTGVSGLFDTFRNGLAQTNPQMASMLDQLGSMSSRFVGVGAVLTPLVVGFKMARDAMREAFYTVKEARDLGLRPQELLGMQYGAAVSGEDPNAVGGRVFKFQQFIGRIAEGDKSATETFQRLTGQSALGKTMGENLMLVAEAFSRIDDTAVKAKYAVEMFGRGAAGIMPDVLEEMQKTGGGGGVVDDEALGVLAKSWKGIKGAGAKLGRTAKGTFQMYLAGMLEAYAGVESETTQPDRLTKSPELIAKEETERKESAKRTLAAKKEYQRAQIEEMNVDSKILRHRQEALDLERKIAGMAGESEAKYKAMTELSKEKAKIAQLEEQRQEKFNQKVEKELQLQKAIRDERAKLDQATKAAADAFRDRSGWTVNDLAGAGELEPMSKTWENGLPQKLYDAAANFLGRDLTRGEYAEMRKSFEEQRTLAWGVTDAEDAAKAFRAMGREDLADSATNAALTMREQIRALTGSEADPMQSMQENIQKMEQSLAALLAKASREGLNINPVNGA